MYVCVRIDGKSVYMCVYVCVCIDGQVCVYVCMYVPYLRSNESDLCCF